MQNEKKIKYDLQEILLAQTSYCGIVTQPWPNSEPLYWIFILPPCFFVVVNIFLVLICSQVLRKRESPPVANLFGIPIAANLKMDSKTNLVYFIYNYTCI